MSLFGPTKAKRVTKVYGRGSLLFATLNPLLSLFMVSRGLRGPQQIEASLVAAENDAQKMVDRGYRIVWTEQYEIPMFGVAYEKVTYELVEPPTGTAAH